MIRPTAILVLLGLTPAAHAATGLSTILADPHTVGFIALNAVLTLYFLVRFDRFAVTHGPEILTTVGIFGCFLGISLALLDFDPANVASSVPHLLNGVKTAFWASVSGVGGALILKARHRLQRGPIQMGAGAPKGATLDDVITSLQQLQGSLTGTAEGSLLGQLKLMRQDQSDQLQAMRSSLDQFSERVAKDGSQALVEALRNVIVDFNAKISEQFGDNFKQLNAAVAELVVWQDQYRQQLDHLQDTNSRVTGGLEKAASHLGVMVGQCNGFTTAAQDLAALTSNLNREYELLVSGQKAMADVLSTLRNVVPEFSAGIDRMLEAMREGSAKVVQDVAAVGLTLSTRLKETQAATLDSVDAVKNASAKSHAEMEALTKGLGTQLQATNAEFKNLLTETIRTTGAELATHSRQSAEQLTKGVQALDEAIQSELNRSMDLFARHLASISAKFVDDYTPLTERLRKVVAIAESVN